MAKSTPGFKELLEGVTQANVAVLTATQAERDLQKIRAQRLADGILPDTEVADPSSPVNLTLSELYALWQQRFGHRWITQETWVDDRFWRIVRRRLDGRGLLESLPFMDSNASVSYKDRLIEEDEPRANC